MALKDLVATKDDLRKVARYERRRADRLHRAMHHIAIAWAAPADRLREMAAQAIRKPKPSKVRRRSPKA